MAESPHKGAVVCYTASRKGGRTMQSLFQKYRHALWFLLFGALSAFYFVSQHLGLRYHVVHLPLDDWLPFWPGFIVFYVLWYFYVPGCMLWACFRARDVFYRQVAALFSGAFVCAAVFVLYPTCVDFRPSAAGPGLARALCRLIYANDARSTCFRACTAMRRWSCIWRRFARRRCVRTRRCGWHPLRWWF